MKKGIYFAIFGTLILLIISGCSRHPSEKSQGYIEGNYTYVATSVSGVMKELFVDRGDTVKKGQPLLTLEAEPESDAYQVAVENLQQAIAARDATAANLAYAKITYERNKVLVPRKALQQSELDRSKANYDATIAQLAQANANIESVKASLASARWTKDQKIISAPVDALVFDKYYRIGEYTIANQAILALLAPQDIKAIFYIPEKNLGGIHLNDRIQVKCDGCDVAYSGHVTFISPTAEYTPPVIYSETTSAKLIFRIEAKFAAKDAVKLHPGQPVIVTYHPHG